MSRYFVKHKWNCCKNVLKKNHSEWRLMVLMIYLIKYDDDNDNNDDDDDDDEKPE